MPERAERPGRLVVDLSLCDGCGVCVESCPTDVLQPDPLAQKVSVAYPGDCHGCFLCVEDCPQKCITLEANKAGPRRKSIYDILGIA